MWTHICTDLYAVDKGRESGEEGDVRIDFMTATTLPSTAKTCDFDNQGNLAEYAKTKEPESPSKSAGDDKSSLPNKVLYDSATIASRIPGPSLDHSSPSHHVLVNKTLQTGFKALLTTISRFLFNTTLLSQCCSCFATFDSQLCFGVHPNRHRPRRAQRSSR